MSEIDIAFCVTNNFLKSISKKIWSTLDNWTSWVVSLKPEQWHSKHARKCHVYKALFNNLWSSLSSKPHSWIPTQMLDGLIQIMMLLFLMLLCGTFAWVGTSHKFSHTPYKTHSFSSEKRQVHSHKIATNAEWMSRNTLKWIKHNEIQIPTVASRRRAQRAGSPMAQKSLHMSFPGWEVLKTFPRKKLAKNDRNLWMKLSQTFKVSCFLNFGSITQFSTEKEGTLLISLKICKELKTFWPTAFVC